MDKRHVPVTMGSGSATTVDLPGLRISDVWFPPGARLPDHTHDRAIFAITLEGFLDSRLRGHELACDAASVWTEPAEERHSNRIGTRGARVVVIMPDTRDQDLLRPCVGLLEAVNHRRDGGVASVARRMAAELRSGDAPGRLALHGLALEALALGARAVNHRRREEALPPWLLRARDLVHDRFREGLELRTIAEQVGIEPAMLAQTFRARFGTAIGSYQRRLRLDWAAAELATTNEALGRIALRAGFYDQAHFTRHFRSHTGQTPGAYRRAHRDPSQTLDTPR
jgi:AraC family transcriptional regulator